MLDPKLLEACTAKAELFIDLQRQTEQAKVNYHFAIRRLHLAGGSYREIASALGLSHQRVSQIVTAESRSWLRRWFTTKAEEDRLACSFCGKSSQNVSRLVAGPHVYICNMCIDGIQTVFKTGKKQTQPLAFTVVDNNSKIRCSFCGKGNGKGRRLAGTSHERICTECIALANEIATQEVS